MDKYIDFEELESLVQKEIDECITGLSSVDDKLASRINHAVFGASRVLTIAKNMPSIEIVRCKDCKYWVTTAGELIAPYCEKIGIKDDNGYRDFDDFCSYGERK